MTGATDQPAANDPAPPAPRLIRLDEVMARVGIGKSAIYSRIRAKSFPAPVQLGGGSVAWVEIEVDGWIEDRIKERDKAA